MGSRNELPDAAELTGRELAGRYRLGELLGQGAMGVVYRAKGPEGDRAVKVLFRESMSGEGALRFLRESRLLIELDHPHVVRVYEAGRDPELDLHYLVLALMRGRDVASVLAEHSALEPASAVRIAAQAARGVAAAHRAGIVHRDLKPENLFLDVAEDDDERIVRVCDFGLAKRMGVGESTQLTRTGAWVGSPSYMSPEQIKSSKHVDERTDVWSLGVSLYEMLTGRLPFADSEDSLASLLTAICTMDATHIQDVAPWIDPGLALVVHKALAREPERRWRSVGELAEALKRFAGGSELLTEDRIGPVATETRATARDRADLSADVDSYFVQVDIDSDPVIGHELGGRYRIQRLLGRGGMGVVYMATTPDGEAVAAKLIAEHAAKDEMAARRLVREVRAAKSIESPNVVKTLDTGTDDELGVPYIVLELLTGVDMGVLLKNEGALSPDVTARLFLQAARGLAAAHGQGVVHRDIKPANLFLHCDETTEEVTVKLCDFGVAKRLHTDAYDQTSYDLTSTGGLLGSPSYMSPEQARNAKGVTTATDVWSLSVAMWEALSGRRLWGAHSTLGELILAICTEDIPPLSLVAPWVPKSLADIVHRGLVRDIAERWTDAAQLAAALERETGGESNVKSDELKGLGPEVKALSAHATTTASGAAAAVSTSMQELSTMGHSAHETLIAARPERRRWPLVAVSAALVAGVAATALVVVRARSPGEEISGEVATSAAEPAAAASQPAVMPVLSAESPVTPSATNEPVAPAAPEDAGTKVSGPARAAAKRPQLPGHAAAAPGKKLDKAEQPQSTPPAKPAVSTKPAAPALAPKDEW